MTVKKKDPFDILAKHICEYMKAKGWHIYVIGPANIRKIPDSLEYNFELVFSITALKSKKEPK